MKKLVALIIFTLSFSAMAILNNQKSLKYESFPNGEAIQSAFSLSGAVVYVDGTISSSTDPFSGKTNKYAESKLVKITALTKGIHVKFGASTVAAATTSDYLILANTSEYFAVDPNAPYLRVIENDATAILYVTEIY